MAYGDFKDLPRKTAYDKVLRDKSFDFVKNPRYDEYQFFDKKSATYKATRINRDAVSDSQD